MHASTSTTRSRSSWRRPPSVASRNLDGTRRRRPAATRHPPLVPPTFRLATPGGAVIRTGDEYRESIRDGRSVWIDGERVDDVPTHPAFRPIVDVRARIDAMTYVAPGSGERCPVGPKLPASKDDWTAKRRAVDTVLDDIGGVVTRVGD